jgi:hypothetical protein
MAFGRFVCIILVSVDRGPNARFLWFDVTAYGIAVIWILRKILASGAAASRVPCQEGSL